MPLRHSLLFSKAKHSDDWHQAIDAIAGVLHPSDSKFPYPLLRQATDAYLKKKGRISQVDTDAKLAILINAHGPKDVAVAAAAHAITASSLRATLHVDLNVSHSSYWGLDTWLRSLVAANNGNPASVTDLEAAWAHHLLPFATHGPGAAGKILIGVSRALRECATPNMNVVPEFQALTSRALADYAAHLEGLRLRNNWVAAHGASYWLAELAHVSSAATPPGCLLPEHIFDSQFPIWRVWARWRPDLRRITLLSGKDSDSAALLPDLLALEGPDFINGTESTLREGLVEQYGSGRGWIKLGKLLIEVPNRTKDGLRNLLESALSTLETAWTASSPGRPGIIKLFVQLTVNRLLTQEALNLVQAVLHMQESVDPDILDTMFRVYTEHDYLQGCHIQDLHRLIQLFDQDGSAGLRRILLTPTLVRGIINCIQDCQSAICMLIKQQQPWTEFALELHAFCNVIKSSKSVPVVGEEVISQICLLLPSAEEMTMAIDIYRASQNPGRNTLSQALIVEDDADKRKDKDIIHRVAAPSFLKGLPEEPPHPLQNVIEGYFLHRLLAQEAPSHISRRIFDTILKLWESTSGSKSSRYRQALAILVMKITGEDVKLGIRCLNGIAFTDEQLGPGLLLRDVLAILQGVEQNPDQSIVDLVRLLASCPESQDFKAQLLCWRDLAYHLLTQESQSGMFKDRNLVDHTLKTMKAAEWLLFLSDVETVFASGPMVSSDEASVPSILRPHRQRWGRELLLYNDTLAQLEETLGPGSEAVRCILSRSGGTTSNFLAILQSLKTTAKEPITPFLHKIVGLLSTRAKNVQVISELISVIVGAPSEAVETCKKVWDAKHGYLDIPGFPARISEPNAQSTDRGKSVASLTSTQPQVNLDAHIDSGISRLDVPPSVVEIMVAGWLLNDEADEISKRLVRSIACLLEIEQLDFDIPKEKLIEAAGFWQKIEDELVQEVQRLETVRKALKAKDPKGTALLLQQIGVADTTELDEEMAKLPPGVIDMVERVDDNEVEMSFSLAALTQLQRTAMGVPDVANTLLLRLNRDNSKILPPSFCLHYNTHLQFESLMHSPYSCSADSENPTKQICSSVQTALTWQLSRVIYSQLRRGETTIAIVYQNVAVWLRDIAQFCISCSTSHQAQTSQLRRSTPCDLLSCARLWYDLPLHVRIPEVRTDTFAVDIALSSVYAAAMTGRPELLPSCPIRGNELVKSILNALPKMAVMRDAVNLSAVLNSYHESAEKLISWAVIHHRGFLATATGLLKIPNLPPGTHQFVLANASPKLEQTFVSKIQWTKRETTVLFHGTSLDRLPAILSQGLRVCSGTLLQRTGAAHGKGIYLADDPATSFYYSPVNLSWKNSGLSNMKLLLGCEVLGAGNRVSGNIHVISDMESVMVRYIMLFTKDARLPIRGHIEPAMASGMKALRSGAV